MLVRHPVVYENEEQCLEAAKALRAEHSRNLGGDLHTYCMAIPEPSEFDAMLKSIEARVARERDSGQ